MVAVTLTGRMDCRKVRIDPSVLSDPGMAEDLIAAAFNDAVNKANAASQEQMGAATAGMPLPPGMKLPFCGGADDADDPPPAGALSVPLGLRPWVQIGIGP